jgi:Fe-Mn family superoxide dismutase
MPEAFEGSTSIYDVFNRSAPHVLPALPYELDALEPAISAATLTVHHGEYHRGFVDALNDLVVGTPFGDMTLEEIIRATTGKSHHAALFNNAAQLWNHTFYWHSLRPKRDCALPGVLSARINAAFGGLEGLKQELAGAAARQFGSGWVWLVLDADELKVVGTAEAGNPLTQGMKPLLTLDVWEHSYDLDYRHRRADYVISVLDNLVNWDFAAENLR